MSEHHIVPIKTYAIVITALMVGTVVTVLIAKQDFGRWNILIAMTIACIKATLVILFFMHAYYSSKLTKVVIGAGLFWFLILMLLTFADYSVRHDWHDGLGALERPGAVAPATAQPAHGAASEHK